ncbi:cell shape determination protein CcmA [Arcticibacter eurypsychrophilus]|uniref:cell shape determination protein CcmA n=1 Tax=Arcticibacter eurypsychrophilus TaxID=1434752 RepID=UPI00084D457D|nr:cell shape determination protein CcmA [Arcticibacter eurypsychrophilus]
MKKIEFLTLKLIGYFAIMALTITACKKDLSGSPDFEPGSLLVNRIEPDSATGGSVLIAKGSGLGSIASIIFEKDSVPVRFNPVFNNEDAIVFRVPDTASGGQQNIVFTNSAGNIVKVPFRVLALPSVVSVSNYNFVAGTQITLVGNNLGDVTSVALTGSTEAATIISKSKKVLVITIPSSINRATLILTNSSGSATTKQEFINLDRTFQIFTENYMNGFTNGSWGPAAVSGLVAKSGTSSFMATFNKGSWSVDGFANANASGGAAFSPDYKFVSFWIKGGTIDYTFYLTADQKTAGYGNSDTSTPLSVPANVWTYFKLPISDVGLFAKGGVLKKLGFYTKGPDAGNETLYFDDVILIK